MQIEFVLRILHSKWAIQMQQICIYMSDFFYVCPYILREREIYVCICV